jgi:trimeric autotransporter adhesin
MRVRFARLNFLLAALACGASLAQTPLPNPNLALKTFGEVNALVRQPDGGLIIGGSFTSIDGVPRANLARVQPDGSLDLDWAPTTDGPVRALAVDGAGALFAGGEFLNVSGLARSRLVKLQGHGAGAPDPDWNPSPAGPVYALAFDPTSGALFVGGWMTQIGGQSRKHLAKLAVDGSGQADPNWNPVFDVIVEEMVVAPGTVYAGGIGLTGANAYPSLGKFPTTGTGARVADWVAARGGPSSLAVAPSDGAVLVGGVGKIARLSPQTGALLSEWSVDTLGPGRVTALAVDEVGGTVHAGATFRLARLSPTGVRDTGWNPALSGAVRTLALGAGGVVVAGGTFSEAGGAARLSMAVFDASGGVGPSLDVERSGYASVLARQPDGGVIAAGQFHKADGLTRRGLLRVAPNGSLDPIWNPGPGSDRVYALAADQNTGEVYVGGEFTAIGGQTRRNLAKLAGSGAGAADPLWDPSPSDLVTEIVVEDTGEVFVAGLFYWYGDTGSSIGGQRRNHLAKLSGVGTGAADPDWNPAPSGQVDALALDGDGGLLVGGSFSQIGGQTSANLARLSIAGAGALDPLWISSANSDVRGLTVDRSGGWVYARGEFTTLGGQARSGLGRVSLQHGAVDATWNPEPNNRVNALELDASGAVYVGGTFTVIQGVPRPYLAKLSSLGTGAPFLRWNAGVSAPGVASLVLDATSATVYAAGTFASVAGQPRGGLAAIAPSIFSEGFEALQP